MRESEAMALFPYMMIRYTKDRQASPANSGRGNKSRSAAMKRGIRKIRIRNTFSVRFSLYVGCEEADLSAAESVTVRLVNECSTSIEVEDFSVQRNVVSFTFEGENQRFCGVYSIVVQYYDKDGLRTVDAPAFELVPHSTLQGGANSCGEVSVDYVEISGNVNIGASAEVRHHNELTEESRALPDQHPIGAITGLEERLEELDKKGGLKAVVSGPGTQVGQVSQGAQSIAVKLDTTRKDNKLQITDNGLYVPSPKWDQFE